MDKILDFLISIIPIAVAIIVFGVLIAVHELGHFLVAKACGIKVNQFAIGMGPAIFKKQKGDTLYALRLFPIGGFCSMEGEDQTSDDDRAFNKKSVPKRIAVVVAGAVMNLLLGFIIVIIITIISGNIKSTEIARFSENALSEKTGLQIGDKIIEVNGMRSFVDSDVAYQFSVDKDRIFDITVIREGEKVKLKEIQFEEIINSNGNTTLAIDFFVKRIDKNVFSVLNYSAKKTVSIGRLIWISLGDLVSGRYKINELSGPVGIVGTIGTVVSPEVKVDFSETIENLLSLVTFITINLGIFNLLPLPALDGGRIVFLIVEGVRKKPIKPEHEGMVHFIGLALLMLLMIVVSFSDIAKLIAG